MLENLGVPCVRPLACGIRRTAQGVVESLLITEGFAGVPLSEWTTPDWPAVFRFLDQMHDSGALQPDLHAGNLLVCPETGELRLVDTGHVRFRRSIRRCERLENIAFLGLSVPIPMSPEAERLSRELRQFVYLHRSKRCLKHNREFGPVRIGSVVWHVRLTPLEEHVRRVVEDPDRSLEAGSQFLVDEPATTIGVRNGLFIKRLRPRRRVDLILDRFRGSRARRCYRRAYHLELLGIPVLRPLAFADRKKAGFPVCSYWVSREIPEAQNLAAVLKERLPLDRSVVRNLAQLIGKLHNEGFSAQDVEPASVLVGPDNAVSLMDPERLHFGDPILEPAAAVELSRLARNVVIAPAVGRLERLAFLRAYCRTRGLRRVPRRPRERG